MSNLFDKPVSRLPSNLLKDTYRWSPFSILNTITQEWQNRKNEWIYILPKSTEGRDVRRFNATPVNTFSARGEHVKKAESISMFDPFLCELMYKWFSRPGDVILDPFAGGSVRGLVAETLGRGYVGIDLSEVQISTNRAHQEWYHNNYSTADIKGEARWIQGDSTELSALLQSAGVNKDDEQQLFDMVFTCPPYYNLEVYTKDPRDLSRAPNYECFLQRYSDALYQSTQYLKPNTFYCICVSEVRERPDDLSHSQYLGLVPDTICILRDRCGLKYYNEIILENNIGSLPIRAPKYFDQSRKIGRHHQNILVFYKGDISTIPTKFGPLRTS